MTITTLSSRELNQDIGRAMKAARKDPVFITDRGKPAHVLLSFEEYQRLTGNRRNIVEAFSVPGLSDIEVQLPRTRQLQRLAGSTDLPARHRLPVQVPRPDRASPSRGHRAGSMPDGRSPQPTQLCTDRLLPWTL